MVFNKRTLNDMVRRAFFSHIKKYYIKLYKSQMSMNGYKNESTLGENEWLKIWNSFDYKTDPIYYRLFSHYVGNDWKIVPEDICRVVIESVLNPREFRRFYVDKNIWDMLYPEGVFPETIIRCMDGMLYDKHYNRLNERTAMDMLIESGYEKMILKPTRDANSSKGVSTLRKSGKQICFGSKEAEIVSFDEMKKRTGRNFIVQPFLKQHDSLSKLCSTSVNPIRITTYRSVEDDRVHVLNGGVLRVGYQGEETDGTHGNGKFIGIHPDGTCKNIAVDFNGKTTSIFNGIDYSKETIQIVNWDAIKATAVKVAERVRHARLLAFDIMVSDNGDPVVLEFNIDDYSIWLAQFTGEAAFGEFTQEIIDYAKTDYNKEKMIYYY